MSNDNKFECAKGADCCGFADVGTIVDNTDCVAHIEKFYDSKQQAEDAILEFTKIANEIASENCEINHVITNTDDKYKLTASFDFTYQVETMRFQLKTR